MDPAISTLDIDTAQSSTSPQIETTAQDTPTTASTVKDTQDDTTMMTTASQRGTISASQDEITNRATQGTSITNICSLN